MKGLKWSMRVALKKRYWTTAKMLLSQNDKKTYCDYFSAINMLRFATKLKETSKSGVFFFLMLLRDTY